MTSSSPPHPLTPSPRHVLLWAVFLGVSWTWCIGMFLPVLLVRDYGIWGWVVFAAPNVIGAAAMGWTIRSPERSAQIVRSHRAACRAFSLVTIAFQVYFAAWFVRSNSRLAAAATLVLAIALLAWVSIRVISHRPAWIALVVAGGIVYLVSLTCLFVGLVSGFLPTLPPPVAPKLDALTPLAAVCVLGFALCPYLDLTFHRARQAAAAPAQSHLAFGIGFGVVFFSMILFTLAYTGLALGPLRGLALAILMTHMTVQLACTIALHVIEAMTGPLDDGPSLSRAFPGWDVLAAALVGVALGWIPDHIRNPYHNVAPGELIYRIFMALYGLAFPAYVWICTIPSPAAQPSRRSLAVFAAAVLMALPFYWFGFIEGKMLWLLPGLLIVLASRAAVPRNALRS